HTMRLRDKTAIVTGAGSGFGRGIASVFAREGARVIVADIHDEHGHETAAQIRAEGGQAAFAHVDVADAASMRGLLVQDAKEFGGMDIVVNNAGATHRNRPMLEVTEDEFDRIYAVKVKSIYLSAQRFVPHFRSQGGGVFVHSASTAAIRPRPGL